MRRRSKLTTDRELVTLPEPQRLGVSPQGMVATAQAPATDAGVEVLENGGNAFDAAAAAAFALGVCEPAASGLGGQTMAIAHLAKRRRTFALDGSSRAPNRATPGTLDAKERLRGYRATTVPSTPATLGYMVERYGKLPLSEVLAPAIRLAEEGYPVTALQRRLTARSRKFLLESPAGKVFLNPEGKTWPRGTLLRQPALAATLRQLAERGIEDFYTGDIAARIDRDMRDHDGLLRADDLAQVPMPIERRPVSLHYGAQRVMTVPPPGAGRTLLEMLNVLQHVPRKLRDPDTLVGARVLVEIIRRGALDRRDRPYDPSFYAQVQDRNMLSDEYARRVARDVRSRLRMHGETTHLSVMDAAGNVVALTQSIERVYGSGVMTPDLGFLYNDYMAAFEYEDMTHPYFLRPNAVPWASVAPSIVFQGRRPWLALGSPGSERIVSTILQVLLRLEKCSPLAAVSAPRLHCSIDGTVSLEAARMRDDLPRVLERSGYRVDVRSAWSFYMGCVQLVMRQGQEFVGVADPRRDGSARGPRNVE